MTLSEIEQLIFWENNPQWNRFLKLYASVNPAELALKLHNKTDFPLSLFINQLQLRKKAKQKLPFWLKAGCLFVDVIFEQASSQAIADYRATIVNSNVNSALDLTAGLGVDASAWLNVGKKVVLVEQRIDLCKLLKHNLAKLGFNETEIINNTAENYVHHNQNKHFDLVFIDPDRRTLIGERLIDLTDCSPNVVDMWPLLTNFTDNIMVKASPLIDIDLVVKLLPNLTAIHTIAIHNEVKEVLLVWERASTSINALQITAHNLNTQKPIVYSRKAPKPDWKSIPLIFGNEKYFYEPNHAIIKAGLTPDCFLEFNIAQIARGLVYGLSNQLVVNFPGRVYLIEHSIDFKIVSLKSILKSKKINSLNIATRNFYLKPEEIAMQLKTKPGGNNFLFVFNNFKGDAIAVWATPIPTVA